MAELQLAKLKRTEITESEMAECNDVERKVWKLWFCKIYRKIKRIGKNVLKFEGIHDWKGKIVKWSMQGSWFIPRAFSHGSGRL